MNENKSFKTSVVQFACEHPFITMWIARDILRYSVRVFDKTCDSVVTIFRGYPKKTETKTYFPNGNINVSVESPEETAEELHEEGKTNEEIAEELNLDEETVRNETEEPVNESEEEA